MLMKALHETAPDSDKNLSIKQNIPGEHASPNYRRILVGTDFSAASTSAFQQGLKLARQNGAELLIAHASTAAPEKTTYSPPEPYGEGEIDHRTEAEKNLDALIEEARKKKVKAHMLLLKGLADDAIVEAAGRLGVDLIVIGSHVHRGIARFFAGSVDEHVALRAPCAVLMAR